MLELVQISRRALLGGPFRCQAVLRRYIDPNTFRYKLRARIGRIPRPSLLAAIIAKAAALNLPGDSQRHQHDLAFLLALMPDPMSTRSALSETERRKLRACPLIDRSHRAC